MSASPAPLAAAAAGPRRFRPQLWPTLFAIAGTLLLVQLGNWQLRRLAWKEDLIAKTEAAIAAPAEAIPPAPVDYAGLDFRHLRLYGRYLADKALGFGFTVEGSEGGAELVQPLQLDDGRIVMVDRGWVPTAMLPPSPLPASLRQDGPAALTGTARYYGDFHRAFFQPADDPARGRWFGWDLAGMGQALDLPLAPILLVADAAPGAAPLPHARGVTADFPNDHLGYAITWYGLAASLVGVYLAFTFRKPDGPHL